LDTKTNERILKILLEVKNEVDCIENPIPIILERCNDLDEAIVKSSLSDLKNIDLITVDYVADTIWFVGITSLATGYFREKLETERLAKQAIAESHNWDLKKMALSYFAGFVSALALMFLREYFK